MLLFVTGIHTPPGGHGHVELSYMQAYMWFFPQRFGK